MTSTMEIETVTKAPSRYEMTDFEMLVLFMCKDDIKHGIDPVLVARKLLENQLLPRPAFFDIFSKFQQGIDRSDICELLIRFLPSSTNITHLSKVLDVCGYRRIASKLFINFLKMHINSISHVHRSESGKMSAIQQSVFRLKHMANDGQIKDRNIFHNWVEQYYKKMVKEKDLEERQHLAHKYMVSICLEIYCKGIMFDSTLYKSEVFVQFKRLVSETGNTLLLDVLYHTRLSHAYSIIGDFENSTDQLRAARCSAFSLMPCMEVMNMLYVEIYDLLWQYEKSPHVELRESVIMFGKMALDSLLEDDIEAKLTWRRMFNLKMAFCMLGIGNQTNIIAGCQVDQSCIKEASNLLADIDRHWAGIEERREMLYYVARARLNDLNENADPGLNVDTCLGYLTKASKIARYGQFAELPFIVEYQETVQKKKDILTRSLYQGNITGPSFQLNELQLPRTRSNEVVNKTSYSNVTNDPLMYRDQFTAIPEMPRKPAVIKQYYRNSNRDSTFKINKAENDHVSLQMHVSGDKIYDVSVRGSQFLASSSIPTECLLNTMLQNRDIPEQRFSTERTDTTSRIDLRKKSTDSERYSEQVVCTNDQPAGSSDTQNIEESQTFMKQYCGRTKDSNNQEIENASYISERANVMSRLKSAADTSPTSRYDAVEDISGNVGNAMSYRRYHFETLPEFLSEESTGQCSDTEVKYLDHSEDYGQTCKTETKYINHLEIEALAESNNHIGFIDSGSQLIEIADAKHCQEVQDETCNACGHALYKTDRLRTDLDLGSVTSDDLFGD